MTSPNRTSTVPVADPDTPRCLNCGAVIGGREQRLNPTGYCHACDSMDRLLEAIAAENSGTRSDRIDYIAGEALNAMGSTLAVTRTVRGNNV